MAVRDRPSALTIGASLLYYLLFLLFAAIAIIALILAAMEYPRTTGTFIKTINNDGGPDFTFIPGDNVAFNIPSPHSLRISSYQQTTVSLCSVYGQFHIGVYANGSFVQNYPVPFQYTPVPWNCDFLLIDSGGNITLTKTGFYQVVFVVTVQRGAGNSGSQRFVGTYVPYPFPDGFFGFANAQAWVYIPASALGINENLNSNSETSGFIFNGTLPGVIPIRLESNLVGGNNDHGDVLIVMSILRTDNVTFTS